MVQTNDGYFRFMDVVLISNPQRLQHSTTGSIIWEVGARGSGSKGEHDIQTHQPKTKTSLSWVGVYGGPPPPPLK